MGFFSKSSDKLRPVGHMPGGRCDDCVDFKPEVKSPGQPERFFCMWEGKLHEENPAEHYCKDWNPIAAIPEGGKVNV